MSRLILFNKPYGVECRFGGDGPNLAKYIPHKGVYPAGRLDKNSEGLVLLTGDGAMQARISHPRFKLAKTYWVQVEGEPDEAALNALRSGLLLKDGRTRPADAKRLYEAPIGDPPPPVARRQHHTLAWLELTLTEGKNRQVRRMTAHLGYPTLRLYRCAIGAWTAAGLAPGEFRITDVHLSK
jgi:23S rRNA pseudouridine2457 synthase